MTAKVYDVARPHSAAPASKLEAPSAVVDAVFLARTLARGAQWSLRIAANGRAIGPVAFSRGMLQRFDVGRAPGMRAAEFARSLIPTPLPLDEIELTVSPYAPPMRQLSSTRQGVPMWSSGEPPRAATPRSPARPATPARAATPTPQPRPAKQTAESKDKVPADLIALLNMHRALGHYDK